VAEKTKEEAEAIKKFTVELFKFKLKPWEIMSVLDDYYGFVLRDAPEFKIKEFYKYFKKGVDEAIARHKIAAVIKKIENSGKCEECK
jgi:hypothetical protein